MELLVIVAVLFGVVAPILAVSALVLALRTRGRVAVLEARLAAMSAGAVSPGPAAEPDRATPVDEPPADAPTTAASEAPAPSSFDASPAGEPPQLLDAPEEAPAERPAPPRPQRPGFEERLGARWAVWVGGLALALGGLFLVRFSIQQGLLGPGARVLLGVAFGLVLLGAGERMRRGAARFEIPGLGPLHLPAVLTAAGAATLFGAAYAAYALYGFIGPFAAFAALGIIAIGTMLAATLHGPLLASLGLVGAFAVPVFVGGGGDDAWALPPYLAAVALASYGVARMRGWLRLALATAGLSIVWALLLMEGPTGPALAHVALQSALAAAFFAILAHPAGAGRAGPIDRSATAALAGFAGCAAIAAIEAQAGATQVWFPVIMVVILLAAALRPPVATGVAAAFVAILGALLGWPVGMEASLEPVRVLPGPLGPAPTPEAFNLFLATAATLSIVAAGFAYERIARLDGLRSGPLWAYASALAAGPLVILIAAWWRITGASSLVTGVPDTPFALVAALIGLVYVALARRLLGEPGGDEARAFAAGASACGALAALALGLAFQLDRGMLTVALALGALGAAYVADRTRLPALRYGSGALGLVVLARVVWDPTIAGGDPGSTLVFNWLLWGYGAPALAFLAASRLLERGGRDRIARLAESLAIVFAALLTYFQLDHALRGGDPLATAPLHLEAGLVSAASLCFAYVMTRIDARRPDVVSRIAGMIFGLGSLLAAAGVLVGAGNPLLTDEALLGGPLFNSLAPAYLLPAVLAGLLARAARGVRPRYFVLAAAGLALALQFAWTMLAVRAYWWFPRLGDWRGVAEGELWAYSAALLLCGMAFLAFGLARGAPWLRLVGALYLLAAVLKVFLVDLSGLEGVMRAMSFIGLGLTLVLVGLVYQKFLARRAGAPHPD